MCTDYKVIWSEENARKSIFVNPRFQLKFSLILSLCGFALSGVLGVFSYTFLHVAFQTPEFFAFRFKEIYFLESFVVTFLLVSVLFCLVLFIVGLVFSSRLVGPLYAFERFMEDFIRGKSAAPLDLRLGDEFRELKTLSERVIEKLRPK